MDIRSRIIRNNSNQDNEIIIVEGNDGAGKTTYCEYLKKVYKEQNKNYCYFHFPILGENDYSTDVLDKKYIQVLDSNLLNIKDENKKQDLIFDNIEQNSGIILNLYNMGYNVIIDRYIISNKVYRLLNNCPDRNNTLPICIVLSYAKLYIKLRYPNLEFEHQRCSISDSRNKNEHQRCSISRTGNKNKNQSGSSCKLESIFHWKTDTSKIDKIILLFNDYVEKYNLNISTLNEFPDCELEYRLGILGMIQD